MKYHTKHKGNNGADVMDEPRVAEPDEPGFLKAKISLKQVVALIAAFSVVLGGVTVASKYIQTPEKLDKLSAQFWADHGALEHTTNDIVTLQRDHIGLAQSVKDLDTQERANHDILLTLQQGQKDLSEQFNRVMSQPDNRHGGQRMQQNIDLPAEPQK